ncbi:hypothetical protein QQF64_026798 [Cirrhinus molitorella]|uniref:SNTX thioredoxin-like domain-containing protein n=1 Tax=Cirrhinus molitorella TaxID=172907 RepID=A0ABR3NAU1_9TELE
MTRNSEKKPKAVPQTWLTGSIRKKMREHLEIFKQMMLLHGDQSTTFLVISKEHTIHPGSCILLYENGSDEGICFTPPSKPACPVIEQISGHNVVVKVSPACPATEELRLLYKMKEEKDWKSQSVQRHDTVTLTDLSPDTEYEMKYAAVGKLNYIIDSDVIRVSTCTTNFRAESTKNTIFNKTKIAVLVVLHHTFDTNKTISDSSKCVNRTDILTVDYLFYEDTGLMKCQKNSDSTEKVVNWLIQQGRKRGLAICPCQNKVLSKSWISSWSLHGKTVI